MHKQEGDQTWLESTLRSSLTRVSAPKSLWGKVTRPREPSRSAPSFRLVWLVAAVSTLTISIMTVARGYTSGYMPADGMRHRYTTGYASLQGSNAPDVRDWIRARTGLDLPIMSSPSSRIAYRSVQVNEAGSVEVLYLADNTKASLLVAKSRGKLPSHTELHGQALVNRTSVSWMDAGHSYTLAVEQAEALTAACLVCHTSSTL